MDTNTLNSIIQTISIAALPVIFAITLHEAAHGYVARRFGDSTAYMLGRLTLNPLKHIDPIGTVLIPLVTYLFGGILFGYAKPVPVNFSNLRHPKQDMFWVAAAGPAANLVMAFFWGAMVKAATFMPGNYFADPLAQMGIFGVQINVVLMVLNLLPLPPLDGGRIAVSLLPGPLAYRFSRIEPYGFIILIVLMLTHILGLILQPVVQLVWGLVAALFGLPLQI
ncbi:MAG: site-2 protease family protein [Betaproteobacteria bacterium]|nr:site-2 protease family protein [Betaproteobacteria bacterium]